MPIWFWICIVIAVAYIAIVAFILGMMRMVKMADKAVEEAWEDMWNQEENE